MACIVAPHTRVVTSSGYRKSVESLHVGDIVFNHKGEPKQVMRVNKIDVPTQCTRFHVSRCAHPVDVPNDSCILLGDRVWNTPDFVNEGDTLYTPRQIKWHVPTSIELLKPEGHGTWKADYHLGYLFGSKLACGFIDDLNDCVTFLYDLTPHSHWQRLIDSVFVIDPHVRIEVMQSQTLQTIRVYSSNIAYLLRDLRQRDGLPHHMRCSNKRYVSGIYDGIVQSNHMHMNNAMYELILWCDLIPHGPNTDTHVSSVLRKGQSFTAKHVFEVKTSDDVTTIFTHQVSQSSFVPITDI